MVNELEVFRYFELDINRKATIRQISLQTKIPYMTLNRTIKKLVKQKIIITEKIGKSLLCSLNKDNLITKHYLIIASEHFKNYFIEKKPLIKRIVEIIKVFRYFELDINKKATIRQISLQTKIPYMTLNRTIKKLERQNLIITEKIGKSFLCSLNKYNPITKHYLILASEYFKNDFIEKKPLIKRIVEIIEEKKPKEFSAILFGAYEAGHIELAFISKSKKTINDVKDELRIIEKAIRVKYVAFTKEKFKELLTAKEENTAKEILKNHVILYNPEIFWNIIYEVIE